MKTKAADPAYPECDPDNPDPDNPNCDEYFLTQGKSARRGAFEAKVTPFEFKFATNEPDGTFEGYGAVFGNEDDNGDLIAKGAFDKTLATSRTSGQMPKMLLNHGGAAYGMPTAQDMLPIGKWAKLAPDAHGLQVKGRLINLDTEHGKRVYGAMKEGELGGLSIGYKARDYTYGTKPNEPRRTLKAVDLHEISPVTFPANVLATISGVKAASGRITTIREFEDFLRDVGRYSHAAAKAIAAGGFKANPPDPRDEDGAFMAALRKRAAAFSK